MRGWYGARDLFRQYDARVTFFVARPHKLSPEEVRMLRVLQDDGHEIGCHSLDHVYLPKWIRTHSADEYVQVQVLKAAECLRGHGFTVTSFAYPHYRYYPPLTGGILRHMRMVRDEGPTDDPVHALLPRRRNTIARLMGLIDVTGMDLPMSYFEDRFDLINQHGGAGVFCGHAISPDSAPAKRQYCSLEDLERVLSAARDRNLEFEPMREIGYKPGLWEKVDRCIRFKTEAAAA